MAGSYITELTKRRNAKRGSTPSIYDACVKALEKLGPHNFGAHDFDVTFRRHGDDVENGPAFFDYVNLSNGKAFTANIVAEIGSESEGTWMRAYPKNIPDSNLPLNDRSKPYRMTIAVRCPTGAPPQLAKAWGNAMNVAEGVRIKDEDSETESFEVTNWVSRSDGAEDQPYDILILRLLPTYEAPKSRGKGDAPIPRKSRPRNKKDGAPAEDVEMESTTTKDPEPKERKVGDTYDPDRLPDHRGSYFAHQEAKLVQRDYKDLDGDLIAPHEVYEKLTEGTLISAQISLKTFIFPANPGYKRNKIYHIYVDKLKIHDKGFGPAWNPPVPELPSSGPSTPKKRGRVERDDEADKLFDVFNSVSPKKSRH